MIIIIIIIISYEPWKPSLIFWAKKGVLWVFLDLFAVQHPILLLYFGTASVWMHSALRNSDNLEQIYLDIWVNLSSIK